MKRRSFLKYATVCNTIVFFPAARGENTEAINKRANQLLTLSQYLTERQNLQNSILNQILKKIAEAGQIRTLDRLYKQWLIFMRKRGTKKSPTQFLQFLQKTNQPVTARQKYPVGLVSRDCQI